MSHNVSPLLTSADQPDKPTSQPDEQTSTSEPIDLSQRQHNALDLLLRGKSDTSVAATVGVCRRTIYRWKHEDDAFKAELKRRRDEINDEATDRLRWMLGSALDVMEEHLKDRYAPICHRAARTLLSLTGLGKSVGIKPNVQVQPPSKAPMKPPQQAEMPPSTARALANAINAIDLLGMRNAHGASGLSSSKSAVG